MHTLILILANTFLVSSIAFIGILSLVMKKKLMEKILLALVSLSAGALMGGAFLHLIPGAMEELTISDVFLLVLIGFVLFFLTEKIIFWRHCHVVKCSVHTFAQMNLFGDWIHNLIDGLIISASFLVSIGLGFTSTLAIILHEIPQEIGDFGVLVYGGYKRKKALFLNFLTALAAIVGGTLGYFLSTYTQSFVMVLLPIAAGGFIYIAASDLIPEIRKEVSVKKSLINFGIFLLGIFLMFALKIFG